jgi:hypothetical protein
MGAIDIVVADDEIGAGDRIPPDGELARMLR